MAGPTSPYLRREEHDHSVAVVESTNGDFWFMGAHEANLL